MATDVIGAECDLDPGSTDDSGETVSARRVVALATAAFLCCGLAWIVALAPFTGIDEFDHAFRADSVAQGHWQPGTDALPTRLGRGDLIPVRTAIAQDAAAACLRLKYTGTYNCAPYAVEHDGDVLIASAAARYNPIYYFVAGNAAKAFSGTAELYAMRVAALLMSVALFATALRSLLLATRSRWPVVALLAGVLPTTTYSAAVAAPNGTQMLAGLAVWASGLALTRVTDRPRWLYPATALSAALLATTHTLGCLWLALICIGLAIQGGFRHVLRTLKPRTILERISLGGVLASIAFELAWVLLARTNSPTGDAPPRHVELWPDIALQPILWPLQAVAAYPMRDDPGPTAAFALTLVVLVFLATVAYRPIVRQPRSVWTVLYILVSGLVVPLAASLATYRTTGYAWQGRYGMPFCVGLFLVLGLALDQRSPSQRQKAVLSAIPVMWSLAQVVGALHVGSQQRDGGYFGTSYVWNAPPLDAAVLLCGLGVVATLVLTRTLISREPVR